MEDFISKNEAPFRLKETEDWKSELFFARFTSSSEYQSN